jgi:long-chain fatty acid transport protein
LTKIAPGYSERVINFKDTWHVAVGAQYRLSEAYLFNGGVAFHSGFQDNTSVALALPANAAWRSGIGGQKQESPTFN